MPNIDHPVRTATHSDDATSIAMDATLFVALELSLSSWVVVASAPGEDKASKHGVAACDGPGLLALLDRLRQRAEARCDIGHQTHLSVESWPHPQVTTPPLRAPAKPPYQRCSANPAHRSSNREG